MGSKYKPKGGVTTTKACKFPKRKALQTYRCGDCQANFNPFWNLILFPDVPEPFFTTALNPHKPVGEPVTFDIQIPGWIVSIVKTTRNAHPSSSIIVKNQMRGQVIITAPSGAPDTNAISFIAWSRDADGRIPTLGGPGTCETI